MDTLRPAHELVSFQCGSDVKTRPFFIRIGTNPVGAQDLPHATQAHGLRPFVA
jgi:hypothetical protein